MWESSTDSRTPRIRLRPSLQVPSPSWQLQTTFRPSLHIHRSRRELLYPRQLAFHPPLRAAAAYHGKPSHMIQNPHTYFPDLRGARAPQPSVFERGDFPFASEVKERLRIGLD